MGRKLLIVLSTLLILFSAIYTAKGITISNPAQKIGEVNLGKGAAGETLLIEGNKMFVFGAKKEHTDTGDSVFNALWIFSLDNPAKPTLLGGWFPKNLGELHGNDTMGASLAKYKNFVVVTKGVPLNVIDVSNPKNPKCTELMQGDGAIGAAFYKHYLIALGVMRNFRCFDADRNFKEIPVKVKFLEEPEIMPESLFVSGEKLYAVGSGVGVFNMSKFPEIYETKEIKDEGGDEASLDNAKLLENFIVGSGYLNFGTIDTGKGVFHTVSVEGMENIGLDKFAKEGRTLYAVDNSTKKLFGIDALNILQPKLQWQTNAPPDVNDIGVHLGYIYILSGNTVYVYNTAPFKDVPSDYWAVNAIKYMVSKNIISGYPDGSFRPEKIVTRAEYAKMLALSLNLDVSKGRDIYDDVPSSHWAYKYITAVTDAHLMKGYGKGKFGPNDTVKKEEIITTIVRLKKWTLINPKTGTFPDVPQKYWAYPYIETAVAHGLIRKIDRGLTDGKFHIKVGATRAQTAELLYRAIKR